MKKTFFSNVRSRSVSRLLALLVTMCWVQSAFAYESYVGNISMNADLLASPSLPLTGDYNDDRIIVGMLKEDDADVKCRVFSTLYYGDPSNGEIEELIRDGRYIKSITPTKFGIIVVDEPNIRNIPQMFTIILSYALKREIEKKFKEGWALTYYNKERGYAIFDKNPAITKQIYMQLKTWKKDANKKIAKWNAKGFYLTMVGFGNVVIQNGHGSNIEQCAASLTCYGNDDKFIKSMQELTENGWAVSSSVKFYNSYGNYDSYEIILDKLNERSSTQKVLLLDTSNGVEDFVANLESGYRIDQIWCGWTYVDYAARRAAANSYKPDWSGIIGGIISGVSQLAGGNSSSDGADTDNVENTYNESSGNSSKKSSSNTSGNSSKANHANWRSLEKSYDGYESQLIRMSNSSNVDKQEVRNIQKKMKEIREKIRVQSGGHQKAVSQWENWNP